ncbi:MAG TPA: hypothetical protein VF746_03375 [Longimicrobium sp.]
MEQELYFESPIEGARGVRIFFVISRTSVTSWEIRRLPGVHSVRIRRSRHGIDLRWDTPLSRGSSILLAPDFEGEPLSVSKVMWFDAEGAVPTQDTRAEALSALEAATDFISDPDQHARAMFVARGAIAQAHPDPMFRRAADFFYDLDLNTNGALLPGAPLPPSEIRRRRGRIVVMEKLLQDRVLLRREWAAASKPGPAQGLKSSRAEAIEHISGVLLGLYRKHLSTSGKLDIDVVWKVFGMFANGELRIPGAAQDDWNSEPNGAMVFGFAEFAFMAMDAIEAMETIDPAHQADLDDWKAILPSHVAIQRIYMEAYRPPAGTLLTWEAYTIDNWSEDQKVSEQDKEDLRKEFSGMSVERLKVEAGQNALLAFRDQ